MAVQKIEISHRTIIFTAVFLALLWLILEIRDILYLLFISFILMSAIRPTVEQLEKVKIPRPVSILAIYILLFSGAAYVLGSLIPLLSAQMAKLVTDLPKYASIISPYLQVDIRSVTSQLTPIGENLFKLTYGVFSNILATLTVLVFTFYLLLERKHLERYTKNLFSDNLGEKIIKTVLLIEFSLGTWLRGQLFLMFIVGFLSYIGLAFLRMEFALPLAIIAGILEIIPVIGPLLSAVPAVLVAVTISPILALATAALYFIVQQLENHIIVPVVMNRAVGLSPLIIIFSLMVGSRLAGTVGAVLAIPVVIMLRELVKAVISRDS